jgi:hypothetical protein
LAAMDAFEEDVHATEPVTGEYRRRSGVVNPRLARPDARGSMES